MPKNIKWTPKQRKLLSKSVAKYNAKLTREIKKNPELKEYLPPRKNVQDLKKSIETLNDLNREVRSINRLFKSGALEPVTTVKGVKTTKYEIEDIRYKVQYVNRKRAEELKNIPENPAYKGILGAVERNMLKPKKFNPDMLSENSWDSFVSRIEKESMDSYRKNKQEKYKQNYLKAIANQYGELAFTSGFYQYIQKLPASFVVSGYYSGQSTDIQFHYNLMDLNERLRMVWADWDELASKNQEVNIKATFVKVDGGIIDTTTGEFFPDISDETEEDIFKE